jgi:hypothetical protein
MTSREVRETQIDPVAGIWYCNNCGRRIQVITESDKPKKQSFICVCGATMQPGEEHAHQDSGPTKVVDD